MPGTCSPAGISIWNVRHMKAINLQTEYLTNPTGIDITSPQLFWVCEGGKTQTAYQVTAVTDGKTVWDSGKTESSSMRCRYPEKLTSRQKVCWRVRLWDENDKPGDWSEEASFEMGLLNPADWTAKWITGNYSPSKKKRYPVDCFRKDFTSAKPVKARLYVSACGLYEAQINGVKVGKDLLTPGSTDYRKRIQYQAYDVTDMIQDGANTISFMLADGWYRGSSGAKGITCTYGKQTKLIAQLETEDADGKRSVLSTNNSFCWSNDGPIRFADNEDGEIVDARMAPTYSGKAKEVKYKANLTASDNFTVRTHERFRPVEVIETPSGKKVLKFEQNLCGFVAFRLNAKAGDTIHMTLGEMMGDDGELTLKNIQCVRKGKKSPLQEFTYTCKEGLNVYEPRFFYGGFQYAQIDTDIPWEKDDFESVALYSDLTQKSAFECSHPLINQLWHNTLWSLKSNSTDLPSDCPTRERMGWTGDSQIFFNTASYLTDYAPFARKHVRDIFDRQWKSGRLPQIAPFANEDWFMWVMNGSVGWACAGVFIPLNFYKKYGDKSLLEEHYEGILDYADFMVSRAGKVGAPFSPALHLKHKYRKYAVNWGQSYGEWAEPNDVCSFVWTDFAAPHPEESTAYTYYTLQRVLEIAGILGKPMDKRLERIKRYSEGARVAYQQLVKTPKFTLDTDRQAKLVRPLYMGLLDEEQTAFAKGRLIKALDNYGWRLGTGFLSTPFILDVLTEMDPEYAYRLLENEDCPGWLFMPKSGATTIWEAWEGNSTPSAGIASLNHYSKGAVLEWLYSTCCGIRMGEKENSFIIKPVPGGSLTYAKASYDSIYGKVSCGWEIKDGKISYTVSIPANTTAEVTLPGKETQVLGAGEYTYTA